MRHAAVIGAVAYELIGSFRRDRGGPGGWRIVIEPEVHLGNDVFVPDVVGWRRERFPTLPNDDATQPSSRIGSARCSPPRPAPST